jgi:glycerate dehydrogenase
LSKFEKLGEFVTYDITSTKETLNRVKDADIALSNKVVIDKTIMDNSPNLKLICITATGMNNVDLEYAKQKGIVVKNAVGYSTHSVAQMTFTLLFSLMSRVCFYDDYVKSFEYSNSPIFTNLSKEFMEIRGKRWGIIGLGNIGKEVAKIASSFGAEVVFYSTSGKNSSSDYKRVELDELLSSSDIVSIHAPLNEATQNLIAKEELLKLKKGAFILNLGRGGIINESDLAWALDNLDIYAGLDVISKEPIDRDNPLLHMQNKERVLITPHIAWASKEAREKLIEITYQNIKNFIGEQDGKRA